VQCAAQTLHLIFLRTGALTFITQEIGKLTHSSEWRSGLSMLVVIPYSQMSSFDVARRRTAGSDELECHGWCGKVQPWGRVVMPHCTARLVPRLPVLSLILTRRPIHAPRLTRPNDHTRGWLPSLREIRSSPHAVFRVSDSIIHDCRMRAGRTFS
jgi:hypothetical protein